MTAYKVTVAPGLSRKGSRSYTIDAEDFPAAAREAHERFNGSLPGVRITGVLAADIPVKPKRTETEYNATVVKALSYIDLDGTMLPDTFDPVWFELVQREPGQRKWETTRTTRNFAEAEAWAAKSGYTLPKKWRTYFSQAAATEGAPR